MNGHHTSINLVSFDDGLHLEQKKRLLRRAYVMQQLQICQLDHVTIEDTIKAPAAPVASYSPGGSMVTLVAAINSGQWEGIRPLTHTQLGFTSCNDHTTPCRRALSECCTQTSKTLLELMHIAMDADAAPRPAAPSGPMQAPAQSAGVWQMRRSVSECSFESSRKYPSPRNQVRPTKESTKAHRTLRAPSEPMVATTKTFLQIQGCRSVQNQRLFRAPTEPSAHCTIKCVTSASCISSPPRLTLPTVVGKLYEFSWQRILDGLHELLHIAPHLTWTLHPRELNLINRKLLECARTPRITMARVACQVCGEMFRIVKCTRRPEFEELVDMLLAKTADANRFVVRDANVALDKMITYMAMFHTVRAICLHAPTHRNPTVRATVARLLICVCVLNGNETVLGAAANPNTRKRVMAALAKLLLDKNQECRRLAERLLRVLQKHRFFVEYFYKDVEWSMRCQLKAIVTKFNCQCA